MRRKAAVGEPPRDVGKAQIAGRNAAGEQRGVGGPGNAGRVRIPDYHGDRAAVMITPLLMILWLTGPCLVVRVARRLGWASWDSQDAAAIGLGLMFAFTGIGHFMQTDLMSRMLPPWVPARKELVYATGILELALAVGFGLRGYRRLAGWVAAAILVLFFPANVYAAFQQVPMGGHAWGPEYLLLRTPVQGFVLYWVYWWVIRRTDPIGQGG